MSHVTEEKILHDVKHLLELEAPSLERLPLAKPAALYDLNGTLASDMRGAGLEHYADSLKRQLSILETLPDSDVQTAFARHGLRLEGKDAGRGMARAVAELVREPARGTSARDVYYDLMELRVRRGEAGASAFDDVFLKGNALSRDRKEGLALLSLSRGPKRLLEAVLQAAKLDAAIDRVYSTLPYGAEKTAKCYFLFYLDLLREGFRVVRAYEDEPPNLAGLLAANIALAARLDLKEPPFSIVWVDRKGIRSTPEGRAALSALESAYASLRKAHGYTKDFSAIFSVTDSLR